MKNAPWFESFGTKGGLKGSGALMLDINLGKVANCLRIG